MVGKGSKLDTFHTSSSDIVKGFPTTDVLEMLTNRNISIQSAQLPTKPMSETIEISETMDVGGFNRIGHIRVLHILLSQKKGSSVSCKRTLSYRKWGARVLSAPRFLSSWTHLGCMDVRVYLGCMYSTKCVERPSYRYKVLLPYATYYNQFANHGCQFTKYCCNITHKPRNPMQMQNKVHFHGQLVYSHFADSILHCTAK